MNTEKIKVTVQDGNVLRQYEGDLIHLNVFNRTDDDMDAHGETTGSNFVPIAIIDGAMESILRVVTNLSCTPEVEEKLLTIMAKKLIKRMEKLDDQEKNIAISVISSSDFKDFLKSIFSDMDEKNRGLGGLIRAAAARP